MTPEELSGFKARILSELGKAAIKLYEFPEPESAEAKREEAPLRARLPFAVIGSNAVGEGRVRCRRYPWGTVEVENLDHNDFIALRNMLLRFHPLASRSLAHRGDGTGPT